MTNLTVKYKQPFHEDNITIAENNNIPKIIYRSRILGGWTIDEAVHAFPSNEELEKNKLKSNDLKYTGNHLGTLEKVMVFEEEQRRVRYRVRYKKQKPWLEKYPQRVEGGEWFEHLAENDIFPKRKVER
ncbi:hypothetical protein [Mammaliicoccus vitulinus]|uniref:hypothetical protein n=1 Tax=Mammaliicoccus vitulinus TaxID=71237 RepID=UPI0028D4B92B|nr:hypothetical protein [Mammaliicoccus vitulinus]